MRILFVAATAILVSAAAQAQEMVPAKPASQVAQESSDRAAPLQTPSSALIEQLKAAGELKDTKTLEAPAPRLEPVQNVKPAEATPAEKKQIEAAPAPAKPTETPVVATPTQTKPVAMPPAAAAPATAATTTVAKPAETKPVQSAISTKPAKKKVARKRETDEQKARRIAAKYGVYW